MLFTSDIFLLLFLPFSLAGWWSSWLKNRPWGRLLFLFLCSLFFYCWWDPKLIWVIAATIIFNYFAGWLLCEAKTRSAYKAKIVLTAGIAANLLFLCYFKYLAFFAEQLHYVAGVDIPWAKRVVLPLGISFFTFQKIAYLVDLYRGQAARSGFVKFGFFVTFFPQLIAGPIVHYREIITQLHSTVSFSRSRFWAGIALFLVGFTKKVAIADSLGVVANWGFGGGNFFNTITAWKVALAYTLQIYFDFSGYSDMAIGLGLMFGIAIPMNFNRPYQAASIIEFWRRWHMTLSAFLRDYLYIPLGGGRHGKFMKYRNLMITMLIGGFWHGAGYNFIFWGAMHGAGLIVNHQWRDYGMGEWVERRLGRAVYVSSSWLVCFAFVVICWVFFRATSIEIAWQILAPMIGLVHQGQDLVKAPPETGWKICLGMFLVFMPSAYQWLGKSSHIHVSTSRLQQLLRLPQWAPTAAWGAIGGLLIWINYFSLWNRVETPPFLYFNF